MTFLESETYPDPRTRYAVASLSILLLILVVVGLLSRRTMNDSKPAWKSASYGEPRDAGSVEAGN
jgi:hypothetical protein